MIKFENVNYIYGRGLSDTTHALHDVTLEIPKGKITAVIGHTGSGKSTLIQLINGLEKPTSGTVYVDGADVSRSDLRVLRFRVGMVLQYPEQQLFEETVERDIAFGPKNMGLSKEEIQRRVLRAAQLVGLSEEQLKKSPFELSGGQKRRAAIAGVIAMEPEVLILDEPSSGLDPVGKRGIFELIKRLHEEGMTIIFVSHSMEDVARLAENVVVLNRGRVAMTGSVEEIFSRSEELEKSALDVPQITKLCARLKQAGFNLPDGVYTVEAATECIKGELNV